MTLDSELIEDALDGNLDRVLDLLRRGANVNARNEYGDSALILASVYGYLEVVRAILNHEGVDVNITNNEGSTALMYASYHGHVEVVRALLEHEGVDVNVKNNFGSAPLIWASKKGHLEVVRALLNHDGVDVNIKNNLGWTALIWASYFGRLDVARLLLNHDGVDVNIKNEYGVIALDMAREKKEDDVARLLEEHMAHEQQRVDEEQMCRDEEERNRREYAELRQDMEEKRRRLEPQTADPPRQNESSPSSEDAKIEQDRSELLHVMNTPSADPVELSLEYIELCIEKNHKLGSGAFGDVFLAEDSRLPKKFAVKSIRLTHCDEEIIEFIRKTFKAELSTLKRFRHPNIIALYGYSLNPRSSRQCLVYEFTASGTLADFLTDDGNRARLSAGIRLSIMFQLVRAVHFLHSGGCRVDGKGWNVFHRDIKSANICLADDFTPRLIDCGLAVLVSDNISNTAFGSSTVNLRSTFGGPAFGTPGYMCPEYFRKKGRGLPCPYIAAYDVYSIGVVLVELILGCLNARQSTRFGTQFLDVFEMYVQDERTYQQIVDGWKKLILEADPSIGWSPDALELVCKAAIQCMAPFPEERLSTKELLDELRSAILLNSNAGIQHPEADSAFGSGTYCDTCNDYRADIQCSEGHALCTACIVDKLGDDSGRQLLCLIKGCSSKPFQDEDLFGRIPVETYQRYVEKRAERRVWDRCLLRLESQVAGFRSQLFWRFPGVQSQLTGLKFDLRGVEEDVKVGFDESNARLNKQQEMMQEMMQALTKGLDRSLAALALLSAAQFKECPNLVWMTPVSVEKKYLKYPKKWLRNTVKSRSSVVFICAHSGEPGHKPFEIEMPRRWIAKIALWLKLCLKVLMTFANSQDLPFPIPGLSFFEQCEMMTTFLDSVVEESCTAVVAHWETLLENGTISIDAYDQMQTLAGDAFTFIAEKAKNEERSQWMPPQMVPVLNKNGTPIWVKGEYAKLYAL